jgi:hypothetical protein
MSAPVSFPIKVLLCGAALVVLVVIYPWLWWQDRHMRRRVRAYRAHVSRTPAL